MLPKNWETSVTYITGTSTDTTRVGNIARIVAQATGLSIRKRPNGAVVFNYFKTSWTNPDVNSDKSNEVYFKLFKTWLTKPDVNFDKASKYYQKHFKRWSIEPSVDIDKFNEILVELVVKHLCDTTDDAHTILDYYISFLDYKVAAEAVVLVAVAVLPADDVTYVAIIQEINSDLAALNDVSAVELLMKPLWTQVMPRVWYQWLEDFKNDVLTHI